MMSHRNQKSASSPSAADRHVWQIPAVRDLFWIGLVIALLWFGYYLRSVFLPVLIGLGLAYVFNPLISYAQECWRLPRLVTILGLLTILILGSIGFVAWLGPIVIDQLETLIQRLPDYVEGITDRYELQLGSLTAQLTQMAEQVQQKPLSVLQAVFNGTSQAFGFIGTVVGTTAYVLVSLALIPVYFFFFAWSFPSILCHLQGYLPASRKPQLLELVGKMDKAVGDFFRGRLIIAFLMATLFAIGWLLAGVPYWFLLGVGTGLLSIIPYAASVGWPLAILLKYLDLTTGEGSPDFAWVPVLVWPSLVYGLVQFFEGWVLTPWIQSESTNLSAVTILIVVFVGGVVGGLYGLILAIPIAACLKILAIEMLLPQLQQWATDN